MRKRKIIRKYSIYILFAILISAVFFYKAVYEVGVDKKYYYPGDTVTGTVGGTVYAVDSGDDWMSGPPPVCDGDDVYIWVEVRDPSNKLIASRIDIEQECQSFIPVSWSVELPKDAKLGTYSVISYYCANIGCFSGEKHDFGSTSFKVISPCEDECSSGETKCVGYDYYTCGNYDDDSCLEWANEGVTIGKCGVECVENSDCPSGYICSNFKCEYGGECYSGETKCEGYNYYVCEDGEWDYRGKVVGKCGVECSSGETKCVGYDYYMCSSYKWNNKGKVIGKCGVECLKNSDCLGGYSCSNYKCILTEKTCEDYGHFSNPPTCDEGVPEIISIDGLTCYTGECITTEKTCEDFGYSSNPPTCAEGKPETVLVNNLTCYTGRCVTQPEPYEIDWKIIFLIVMTFVFGVTMYWYLKK